MSYDTSKNWVYQSVGRNINLWQYVNTGATDTVGDYKVKLPSEYYGKQLVYPAETITSGLLFEGTAFVEPFLTYATGDPNELTGGNANPTLEEDTTPDATSSINASRMLSLAVVDYLKAMMADRRGDLATKEYYMKEFWKKAGDHDSNRRMVAMSMPSSPYAVK